MTAWGVERPHCGRCRLPRRIAEDNDGKLIICPDCHWRAPYPIWVRPHEPQPALFEMPRR